jgi:hypothetical protein
MAHLDWCSCGSGAVVTLTHGIKSTTPPSSATSAWGACDGSDALAYKSCSILRIS